MIGVGVPDVLTPGKLWAIFLAAGCVEQPRNHICVLLSVIFFNICDTSSLPIKIDVPPSEYINGI